MLFEDLVQKVPIHKGWSCDQKYCVTASDGTRYLLRITPFEKSGTRKKLFELLQQVAALGIPMCRPVEFGSCGEGVYTLHTWIDGEDAEAFLPRLPEGEQYVWGRKAGEILTRIHSIPAPADQEDWSARFTRKTDTKIQKYRDCGIRFEGDGRVIEYLTRNRDCLVGRPQAFQHGDYHIGNMMVQNGGLVIIDFDRFDFGDPWEEFNRIVWCARLSPQFASGMVDGYFQGSPPMDFWTCLGYYIGSNTVSSLYWAMDFGQEEIDVALGLSKDILSWYHDFESVIPAWYAPHIS